MADNYQFPGANKVFEDATKLGDGVDTGKPDMWTYFNGWVNFSRWRLSMEEIAEINRTGEIVVAQMTGKSAMHQLYVGSYLTVREATVDFGKPMPRTGADTDSINAFNSPQSV